MVDGVKCYQLRKVENGVAHGSQIYHDTETGNNRLFIIGAQIREQRRKAAMIHGENSERVRKIGRETMNAYRQDGHDRRTYGTKPMFNGYVVKSKWKIVDYESADRIEEVLELTSDRTGNTIDEDLKFHFTRFEGNNEQAVRDVESYKYYFKLASVKCNPKVDKATHRNSKRFWDECRAEEQRQLENELLESEANIEIKIPSNNVEVSSLVADDVPSDAETTGSLDTVVDLSLEVNVDSEQEVSFTKSFSDDSLKSKMVIIDPESDSLKQFIVDTAPKVPGILCSSLILGKVLDQAINSSANSVVVRRRSRIPNNLMDSYNPSSPSSKSSLSSSADASVSAAAASNEAQSISLAPVAEEEEAFPPPPKFITPPPQPMLVTAPVSINFELSESAPTVTPPSPFANDCLTKQQRLNTSTLEKRKTPPPVMLSLAEPKFHSITTSPEASHESTIKALENQLEEYHIAAEIDVERIEELESANRKHKKQRFELGKSINTLRVAGSAMSLIVNDSLKKFNTPRFDMDLTVNESHSSTRTSPQVSIEARKSVKSANDCIMVPKCATNSPNRCTFCELQWITSLVSVIWNDAMNTTGLVDAVFLVDHFDPCAVNGPPPDYFSKPGELSLIELDYSKLVVKRSCDDSSGQQQTRQRRIDSEEVLSADDSVDRESLKIKREVVGTHRVEVEKSVWTDSEQFDVDSDAESAGPDVSNLPRSDNDEMC